MALPVYEPMLATSRPPSGLWKWAVEPKMDGWRAIVAIGDGVGVRTRSGRDVSSSLPELAPISEAVAEGTVLDGELVAGQGLASDFYRLRPSLLARRRATPITFVAFDVVHLAGRSIVHLPDSHRRRLLELLELDGSAWCTVTSFDGPTVEVLDECLRLGLEGLVAKRVDSTYRPGRRSPQWLKVKTDHWLEHHAPLRHERHDRPAIR